MNYRKACAEVFRAYPDPQARSHAVSFLERYADSGVPVSSWHAAGRNSGAVRLLIESLGLKETEDIAVEQSVLDPGFTRFSWTQKGMDAVTTMRSELSAWSGAAAQSRILAPAKGKDPLDAIPEGRAEGEETPAEPEAPNPNKARVDGIIEATLDIARKLADNAGASSQVILWARTFIQNCAEDFDPTTMRSVPPFAPLQVLEEYMLLVRDGVPAWVDELLKSRNLKRVFRPSLPVTVGTQAARMMAHGESTSVSDAINLMPLSDQIEADYVRRTALGEGSRSPLHNYMAFTLGQLRTFGESSTDRNILWVAAETPVAENLDALNMALDAEKLRTYTEFLVEHAYPGYQCKLLPSTMLGIDNRATRDMTQYSDALRARIETSTAWPRTTPVYRCNFLLYRGGRYAVSDIDHVWDPLTAVKITPKQMATDASGREDMYHGVRTCEIATEWFEIVHGPFDRTIPTLHYWTPKDRQTAVRNENVDKFHRRAESLAADPGWTMTLCGPDNPEFVGYEGPDGNPVYTEAGAFVNGLVALIRSCAVATELPLSFVRGPRHPDKFVAGVWSGISTDLAPDNIGEAEAAGVFPDVREHGDAGYATAFLNLMHSHPEIQHKFGKRTNGSHRRHVIVVETNVDANSFARMATDGFAGKVKWLFTSVFMNRGNNPFSWTRADVPCMPWITGLRDWIKHDCPDLLPMVPDGVGTIMASGNSLGLSVENWKTEDGRLAVVVSTTTSEAATKIKMVHRYANDMPVASAYYNANRRSAIVGLEDGIFIVDPSMSESDKFAAALHAVTKLAGFGTPMAGGSSPGYGNAGPLWSLKIDEHPIGAASDLPTASWYASQSRPMNISQELVAGEEAVPV